MLRSIAAKRARTVPQPRALRCVSKHEGNRCRPSSSFETRARALKFAQTSRMRAPQDEDEHRVETLFTFQTADLVPAARFCARVLLFGFAQPREGVAERRETYGCLRGIRWACTIGAGQAPSEAPCVPIRGTLASRRSHRGGFGRRAALPLTGIAAGSVIANSRVRVVVPGGGPLPPGATVANRRRRTPRLAPSSGSSLEHAP
jgi:hypothetical protein